MASTLERLTRIELFHLAVPLKKRIAHASHERVTSDNLLVRATLRDGTQGFGEGVPRAYVTGETIDSCFEAIGRWDVARMFGDVGTLGNLVGAAVGARGAFNRLDPVDDSDFAARGISANAAWCAVELAVVDAHCRRLGVSVGDFVRALPCSERWKTPAPAPVRYSGAITAEGSRKERISAWKMRLYGFAQVKVKVGVPGQDDGARLRAFRSILGKRVDMRIDANEAWQAGELVEHIAPLLAARPSVLEQPVPHAQVDELAGLRAALGIPVMLDESLCGLRDAMRSIELGTTDFFNVRLSKCGGIVSSLELIDVAFENRLGVQLGCHPGETGVLSAAGRHVAANIRGLAYLEGSYDRHVLGENVIVEDITFRFGGRARPLDGPGLGVTVDPARLEHLTQRREVFEYE